MSLDGFVAQPDDNPAELFDWYWNGDVVVPSAQEGMSFSVAPVVVVTHRPPPEDADRRFLRACTLLRTPTVPRGCPRR